MSDYDLPAIMDPPNEEVEFDHEALAKLIAEALGEDDAGSNAVAFGDTQILEALSDILPQYMDQADVAAVFDQVRTALYKGLDFGGLRQLHTTIKNCRICPNVAPDPQLPAWNRVDPDIVFVMDTPWTGNNVDRFFTSLLQDIGFTSRRIAYTSTVRCFPKGKRPPSADEVSTCTKRYLFNELQQMQPKLIVACGAVPSAAILGEQLSVSDVRGTFYWLGPWPVMVTVSPGAARHKKRYGEDIVTDLKAAYAFTYGEVRE